MRRRYRNSYIPYRSYTAYDYAQMNIEKAKKFSFEFGGIDIKVKNFFFNLDTDTLSLVLNEYGEQYGKGCQRYAKNTIPKWKSGQVNMSGDIADRLCKLLPKYMPLNLKYEIASDLWVHCCPKSNITINIPNSVDYNIVYHDINSKIDSIIKDYNIPDHIKNRFKWLFDDDINALESILNKLMSAKKAQMISNITNKAGTIINQANQSNNIVNYKDKTDFLNHNITVNYRNRSDGIGCFNVFLILSFISFIFYFISL